MDRFDQMAKALFPAHPHFRGGVAQALRTVRAEALEEAAKACREYAHSGDVSMMRRQVAYACERRVRELKENGDSISIKRDEVAKVSPESVSKHAQALQLMKEYRARGGEPTQLHAPEEWIHGLSEELAPGAGCELSQWMGLQVVIEDHTYDVWVQ